MFEYLMLGDVRARKYSKTGARTHSILKKFAFDTTLMLLKLIQSYVTPKKLQKVGYPNLQQLPAQAGVPCKKIS